MVTLSMMWLNNMTIFNVTLQLLNITSRKPARCAGNFDVVFIYLLFIDK